MAQMTMVEAICDALRIALESDPSVLILGEDVGKNGGVFRATDGLWEKFGDHRVIDTPLAESAIIGTSIGLCINGFKPVAEIQFMGFIYPAFEQIVSHLARFRTRTQGNVSPSLVIRVPVGGGVSAPELHSESTESLFAHIPGLKVVMPSTPTDAKGMLLAAIADPNPVIFLEPIKMYRWMRESVLDEAYIIPLGKARTIKTGKDVTLLTWGSMTPIVQKAAFQMEKVGISCEVIDLRTLVPLDEESIFRSVKKTGRAVIVHEAPRTVGFGAEISALIQEHLFLYLQAPILRVTGYDVPVPMAALEKHFLPNEERVITAIQKVLQF